MAYSMAYDAGATEATHRVRVERFASCAGRTGREACPGELEADGARGY